MPTMMRPDERGGVGPGEHRTDAFTTVFRRHAAGVVVLTADPGDGPVAITISSLSSVSAAPPLLAFSLSESSSTTASLLAADRVVVHFVTEGDIELAQRCATRGVDRFEDADWTRTPTGEPYFTAVRTRVHGDIAARFDVVGATLVVVEATRIVADAAAARRPLVYHDRTWHALDDRSRVRACRPGERPPR